jgi:hypothetical protein
VDTSVDDVLLSKLVEETPTEDDDMDVRIDSLPTPPATPGIFLIYKYIYIYINNYFIEI